MELRSRFAALAIIVPALVPAPAALAGPLDPPSGPISPTPGPEPRIALNVANTPGDADSLLKITQPGSYYLTGNLTGVAGRHGIEIVASNVTIDLNGFTLQGVPGSLSGIIITIGSLRNVDIHSGSVNTWGGAGVNLANFVTSGCALRALHVSENTSAGISIGIDASVIDCVATNNSSFGIITGRGNVITNCRAANNNNDGINTSNDAVITGCTSVLNSGVGIRCGSGSSVSHCVATSNDGHGLQTGSGATICSCSASSNGGSGMNVGATCTVTHNTVRQNDLDGIVASSGALIYANTCIANGVAAAGGAGIHTTSSDNRIEGNNCCGQDRGIDVDIGGNIIIRNTCSNNTINWDLAANNHYGPIINRDGVATAAVSGDAATEALGSTHANANFTY